ncbi:MAG: NAD(P)H-quinone oxidoreductase subunit 3 [Planctomycetes bacterium ADurb.Bin126]|jgi:NADH-quinone oxidoreductase subunit A|nr:MAG: NAD(P)H-quinone oxidoreductase subunit 3 [Planctomycetes bacterium ADurb.Bin126]
MTDKPAAFDPHLWPLDVYAAAVLCLVAVLIGLSHVLGERHSGRTTGEPYESGLAPTGAAWTRFNIKYFLVAVFFVIFDVEAVFIFAWAVVARQAGWEAYCAVAVFIGVLAASLGYLWRMGALDWGEMKRQRESPSGGSS